MVTCAWRFGRFRLCSVELGIGGLDQASEIGVGGSAVVYRARQVDLDREVAVKVLSVTDEAFVRRFKREAKTLGRLGQSPSVVTVYDTGITTAGQPYLILELCTTSVLEQLQANGPMDPYVACEAGAQVADALAEAHRNGVVHRDIKPGNILIGQTGRYMVTDFGISTISGATLGQTNSIGFTASYVAPETLTENEAGPPADVYSLGATLFHMMAGRAPYVDNTSQTNLLALAERVANEPVPNLRPMGVPDQIFRVVEGAMAKDPADRPTATGLAAQLRSVLSGTSEVPVTGGAVLTNEVASGANQDPTEFLAPVGAMSTPPEAFSPQADPGWIPPPGGIDQGVTRVQPPMSDPPPPQPGDDMDRPILGNPNDIFTAAQPGDQRLLPNRVEEAPRRSPLLLLSAMGLIGLLGLAGFLLISGTGDDESGDGSALESVEGPTTTLEQGLDATDNDPTGSTSTLDPAADAVQVPTVIGLTAADATDQLLRRGFEVIRIEEQTGAATAGSVIRQDPGAGDLAEDGAFVTIVVATETPVARVVLPSVSGQSANQAAETLSALGLRNVGPPQSQSSDTVPAGVVIGTVPGAGAQVAVDEPIQIIVSAGPDVPDCAELIGGPEAAAVAAFEGANITVDVSTLRNAVVPEGNVSSCVLVEETASLVISTGPLANPCANATGQTEADVREALELQGYSVATIEANSLTADPGEITACSDDGPNVTLTIAGEGSGPLTCPNVAGMTVANATQALTAVGVTEVETTAETSETVPDGIVISCDIANTTASLVVSSGPLRPLDLVTVPDVAGRTVNRATNIIEGADLAVAGTNLVPSDEPEGTVIGTAPEAGAMVPEGTEVTLQVSSGPAIEMVAVPDVINRGQNAAVNMIQAAGLRAVVEEEEDSPDNVSGRVIRTDPGPGSMVPVNSIIVVVVGS